MFKKALIFIVAVSVFLTLAAGLLQGRSSDAPQTGQEKPLSLLEQIKKTGKLVLGTTDDYPPYEFRMLGDKRGSVVGLDIDIANEIATALGVSLEIKIVPFHELLDNLNAGNVDIVIAAMAPTEERKKTADFSNPYFKADNSMLMRKEKSTGINSIKDLKGKKVGVQMASIQMELAIKYVEADSFVEEDDMTQLVACLNQGKCDAIILEKPVADAYAISYPDLVNKICYMDDPDKDRLGGAIAVKKGNAELLLVVNDTIARLKETKKIDEFIEKSKILTADVIR